MAYENFTTYDETDEGTNITVIASKVSWNNLDRDETSHVSDSKGIGHFSGDFTHLFEIQYSDVQGTNPLINFWGLANAQADLKALVDASADAHTLLCYNGPIRVRLVENGSANDSASFAAVSGTTYYITITRDDDGGVNNTGQVVAYVRTGSHSGNLEDTLTVDASAGEQNDFEYVFGVMSYDDSANGRTIDGFIQNLDLGEVVAGAAGIMTTNTGFWGPTF